MSSLSKATKDLGLLRGVLKFIIYLYRYSLGGLLGGQCRFYPSCSTYALECCDKLHFREAIIRITWRILRCHPWSKGGYEPLPGRR
ncbi:MAG: membrane protein insertion efficiency factor YidD [Myxococcales bacterium]|nr:membrane protein insertion efficiency factor YidD [Myxococcales bacterium]